METHLRLLQLKNINPLAFGGSNRMQYIVLFHPDYKHVQIFPP